MTHAFSIDVEDWYQGIGKPPSEWTGYEMRVEAAMDDMLELLARYNVRATCFILGKLAEDHPQIVRAINSAGHEIASHGFSHIEVFKLSPDEFREEIRRSVGLLQDLTGQQVIGYRAPYFTIVESSLWALDILSEEGLLYDSSIHPITHYRCGITGASRLPSHLELESGRLVEIPVSTFPIGRYNLPVGGGFYLRFYPYSFLSNLLRKLEKRGETIGLYLHPWEIDPEIPRVKLPPQLSLAHYHNLDSTYDKIESLLSEFAFAPYKDAYSELIGKVEV